MPKPPPFDTATPRLHRAATATTPKVSPKVSGAAIQRLMFIVTRQIGQARPDEHLLILSLAELCKEIVTDFDADAAVFSLFGQQEDATQIVTRLGEIGFSGKCIVLAPALPRPDLVLAELTALCPTLNLELILAADAARDTL